MASCIWQAKIGANGTYTDMPSPRSFKLDWEDLDKNSYRSTINGNLFRHPLSKHWAKVSFSWSYITEANLKTVVEMVNQDNLYIRCISPAFGTNSWVELPGYVSKMSADYLEGRVGWTLAFNFVQGKVVSGQ